MNKSSRKKKGKRGAMFCLVVREYHQGGDVESKGGSSSKEPGLARACVPGHLRGWERVGGPVGLAGWE
jgi:hypothetical protein